MAVSFVFNADNRDVLKKLEETQRKLAQVEQQQRQAGETNKRSLKEQNDLVGKGIDGLKGMVLQFVSVGAAVSVVSRAYADWRREMEKLGAEHRTFSANLVREIAAAGDLAQGGRIEQRIRGFDATRAQSLELLTGIRESTPATDLERRLELAEAAAPLAATGRDMKEFGQAMGEFQDFAPGMKAGDVADLTAWAQSRAGGEFGKTFSPEVLRGIGVLVQEKQVDSFEEGLGTVLAALDANVSAKILPMLNDPKQLKGMRAKFAQLIPKESIQARTAEAFAAKRDDFASRQVADLANFPAGQEMLAEQQVAIEADRAAAGLGARESERLRAVARATARLNRQDASALQRFFDKGVTAVEQMPKPDITKTPEAVLLPRMLEQLMGIKNNQRPVNVNGHNE